MNRAAATGITVVVVSHLFKAIILIFISIFLYNILFYIFQFQAMDASRLLIPNASVFETILTIEAIRKEMIIIARNIATFIGREHLMSRNGSLNSIVSRKTRRSNYSVAMVGFLIVTEIKKPGASTKVNLKWTMVVVNKVLITSYFSFHNFYLFFFCFFQRQRQRKEILD